MGKTGYNWVITQLVAENPLFYTVFGVQTNWVIKFQPDTQGTIQRRVKKMNEINTKTIDDMINDFAEYEKQVRGKSKGWIEQLKKYLRKYMIYLEKNGLDYIRIKLNDAMDFKKYMAESEKKYTAGYINAILITLKMFYRFMIEKGYVYSNPFEYTGVLRYEEKVKSELPKEKKLCDMLDKISCFYEEKKLHDKITRYKLHVAAELQYSTGCRISEIALLKEEDINLDRGVIKITDLKTKKERYGFLNEYALKVLKRFMESRKVLLFCSSKKKDYLFNSGIHHLTHYMNVELTKIADERFTSHILRHCFGYHFLKRGCDIYYIKYFLGHESIDNTQIYTRIDKEDLKNILLENHPRTFNKRGLK